MRKPHIRLLIAVMSLALLVGLFCTFWIPSTVSLEPLSQFPDEFSESAVTSEKYFCQPVLIHKPRHFSIIISDINVLDPTLKRSVEGVVVYAYDSSGNQLGPGIGSYSISEFFSNYPSSINPQKYHVISQDTVLFILTPLSFIQQDTEFEVVMEYRYLGVANGTATTVIT